MSILPAPDDPERPGVPGVRPFLRAGPGQPRAGDAAAGGTTPGGTGASGTAPGGTAPGGTSAGGTSAGTGSAALDDPRAGDAQRGTAGAGVGPAGVGEQTTTLRPFVITAGRVEPVDPDIGMETQVTAQPGARPAWLPAEKRAIVTLCVEPHSVAEISARLRLHLGVTKILVGDLRAAGQLDVHVLEDEFPDPETILRVIRGLRAIS